MSLPPFQGPPDHTHRSSISYDNKTPIGSPAVVDQARMDAHAYSSTDVRYSSLHRPEHLQSLQPSSVTSHGAFLSGSNATTPRQSAFSRDQVDRAGQSPVAMPQSMYASSSSTSSMPSAVRFGYFDAADSGLTDDTGTGLGGGSLASAASSSAWHHSSMSSSTASAHRSAFVGMPTSAQGGYGSAETMGYPTSNTFAYDTSSSESNSPNRPQQYYDVTGAQLSYPQSSGYAMPYGSSSRGMVAHAYGTLPPVDISTSDIDAMLNQISTLYKTANTKKNAEFYRDKWARIWLSCNYTLKPSIQISIPRTILHESYRRACEEHGIEPLQAASFGKVLRGQFPDVAQRRLGGRGKTRFHYCGFGTSNEREAIKVKQLLDDEKAGRLQLSAGMSAEYMSETRSRANTLGDDDLAKAYRADYAQIDQDDKSLAFVPSSSVSGGTHESAGERIAASAFATLNSAVTGQEAPPMATASSAASSGMPRRHTVSFPNRESVPSSSMASSASGSLVPAGMPSTLSAASLASGFGLSSREGERSSQASQTNSPNSFHGSTVSSRPQSAVPVRRHCSEFPDWPVLDDSESTLNPAGSSNLSPAGKAAWRDYEAMCQDLLQTIFHGPDLVAFDRRLTAFWSSLSQTNQEAMRSESALCDLILRGDGIIFRQLLARLDDLIGEDLAEERIHSIQSVAMSMSTRVQNLLEGRLPPTFVKAKVQAAEKVAEGLDNVARIYETIKHFRDQAMVDSGIMPGLGQNPNAATVNANSFAAGAGGAGVGSATSASGQTFQRPPLPFQAGHLAQFQQGRRRDDSISSSISDSHYTWLSGGDQPYSSSASESEFSMHSGADPSHITGMQAPIARKWSGATRTRMASGPLSRSTGNSEVSGPVSSSFGGMALTQQQHHLTGDSPSRPATGGEQGSQQAFASPSSAPPSSLVKNEANSSLSLFMQNPERSVDQTHSTEQQQDHQMGDL